MQQINLSDLQAAAKSYFKIQFQEISSRYT